MHYVSIKNATMGEIIAGRLDGSLVPWSIDAAGVRWYKRQPEIHGVPKEELSIHGEGFIDAEPNDDDGECEMIGDVE